MKMTEQEEKEILSIKRKIEKLRIKRDTVKMNAREYEALMKDWNAWELTLDFYACGRDHSHIKIS